MAGPDTWHGKGAAQVRRSPEVEAFTGLRSVLPLEAPHCAETAQRGMGRVASHASARVRRAPRSHPRSARGEASALVEAAVGGSDGWFSAESAPQ